MYEIFIFEDKDNKVKALANDCKHGTGICEISPRYRDEKYINKNIFAEKLEYKNGTYFASKISRLRLDESLNNDIIYNVDGSVKKGKNKFKCLEDFENYDDRMEQEAEERRNKIITYYKELAGISPESDIEYISDYGVKSTASRLGYPIEMVKNILEKYA